MKVRLAGFNIDKSLIDQLDPQLSTPEVISAAYARISRSAKSVSQLRKEALLEIEKARKSNSTIIFEMGHSSIAEHAVFNLDIIGVSRLLTDTIQKIRLASFTEKSQRYVTLDGDYVVPKQLEDNQELLQSYHGIHRDLFDEYSSSFDALRIRYEEEFPNLSKRDREGKAKEDARYILPLSTATQMGLTINSRSLENLLRHLDASPLEEAHSLHKAIYEQVFSVSPSLLRYTTKEEFRCAPCQNLNADLPPNADTTSVKLQDWDKQADDQILAAMYYPRMMGSYEDIFNAVASMPKKTKQKLWNEVFEGIKAFSKVSRAFEYAHYSFELQFSESCWAQFKRHRISSFTKSQFTSPEPLIIPEAIVQIGRKQAWEDLYHQVQKLKSVISTFDPALADYLRLNLDRVKVLAHMNLRELYHFARLRSDAHAQWEIRSISDAMLMAARKVNPQATALLGAKSDF